MFTLDTSNVVHGRPCEAPGAEVGQPCAVYAPIHQLLPGHAHVDCRLLVCGISEDHLLVASAALPTALIYLVLPDNVRDIEGYAYLWYGQRCHDFQVWDAGEPLLFAVAARWVLAEAVQTMSEG